MTRFLKNGRCAPWTSAEEQLKSVRGYGLLTLKPVVVIINIGDDQDEIELDYDHP